MTYIVEVVGIIAGIVYMIMRLRNTACGKVFLLAADLCPWSAAAF